jgi:hypothetical protein
VGQAEDQIDTGVRDGGDVEREQMKTRWSAKSKLPSQRILKLASAFSAQAELDPSEILNNFVDQHRQAYEGRVDHQSAADRPVRLLAPRRPPSQPQLRCSRANVMTLWCPHIERL